MTEKAPRVWTLWYKAATNRHSHFYAQPMFDGPEIAEDTKVIEHSAYLALQAELNQAVYEMDKAKADRDRHLNSAKSQIQILRRGLEWIGVKQDKVFHNVEEARSAYVAKACETLAQVDALESK